MNLLQKYHLLLVSYLLELTLDLQILHKLVMDVDDGILSHMTMIAYFNLL